MAQKHQNFHRSGEKIPNVLKKFLILPNTSTESYNNSEFSQKSPQSLEKTTIFLTTLWEIPKYGD